MKNRLLFSLLAAMGLCAAALPIACFSLKEPPCAFSCVTPPNRCPENYTCQADGLCHRQGATGICTLAPPHDAAAEAASGDGGADLPPSGDAGDAGDATDAD